ncbi:hypothetical protein LPC27_09555 [Paraclostridium bifermentans]|uniref:hypothetical protein n=1 Tax=Paraclostridium bifermentans TaxID=1490 RepID=UPI001F36B1DA|nr:hypothetical protein [Paraclostridium bifermentans]MCE9676012.1 hypothetical protein [Paraclostridium bifermentans]
MDFNSIDKFKPTDEIEKIYSRIDRIMANTNTEDIISGIVEYQFMDLMDELRLNKAELVAGRAIKFNVINSKYTYLFKESERLLELSEKAIKYLGIKDIFEKTASGKDMSDEEKKKIEKSISMRTKSIFIRGDAYSKQLVEFSKKLYSKFDGDIERAFGFTYSQCQDMIIYVYKLYKEQTEKLKNNFEKIVNSPIAGTGYLQNENYAMQSISKGYVYRVDKQELYNKFGKDIVDNIISYLSLELGQENKGFNNIDDFNILYSKPIINFGEYIYIPLPISAIQNLPKLFHYEFITKKNISKIARSEYTKWRGDLIEELTAEYLERLFMEKSIYKSLYYFEKGERFESDVTVQVKDTTLLCECKSKILVLSSLKGNLESIEKDFNDAIGKAYEQAKRTQEWIMNEKNFELDESKGNSKVVKLNKTTRNFKLCIVAENFGWIASNIAEYIEVENKNDLPLVINIYDLDIITREVKGYKEFIKYLEFRNKYQEDISFVDELEMFCAFTDGRFESQEFGDVDKVYIDKFTEELDMKYGAESETWLNNYKI